MSKSSSLGSCLTLTRGTPLGESALFVDVAVCTVEPKEGGGGEDDRADEAVVAVVEAAAAAAAWGVRESGTMSPALSVM